MRLLKPIEPTIRVRLGTNPAQISVSGADAGPVGASCSLFSTGWVVSETTPIARLSVRRSRPGLRFRDVVCSIPFPEHPVQNLPRGGARHCLFLNERDGLGARVAGDLVSAPVEQLVLGRALAFEQHYHGMYHFAPFLVWHADDR